MLSQNDIKYTQQRNTVPSPLRFYLRTYHSLNTIGAQSVQCTSFPLAWTGWAAGIHTVTQYSGMSVPCVGRVTKCDFWVPASQDNHNALIFPYFKITFPYFLHIGTQNLAKKIKQYCQWTRNWIINKCALLWLRLGDTILLNFPCGSLTHFLQTNWTGRKDASAWWLTLFIFSMTF